MLSAKRMLVVGSAVAVGLLGAPGLSGTALAKTGCGAVIKTSTTLTADVGPCPGVGLTVRANNIILDLGGHRVFGTAAEGVWAGVRLDKVSGVTVKNGSVDNFDAGVEVFRGQKNTVVGLDVHDNNSAQFVADNPDLGQLGDGILILGSKDNTIRANQVHDNGPFSGISVVSETANQSVTGPFPTGNLITGNTVRHNEVDDVCTSAGDYFNGPCTPGEGVFNENIGVRIEGPGATHTTISKNVITESGREGLAVLNTRNRFTPPDAISPQNTDTYISDNEINHNGVATVVTDTDPSIGQLGGDGVFTRCFTNSPPAGCATRTTIVNNRLNDNLAHGIAIDKAEGNTIIGNTATGNGHGTMTSYASDPPYTDGFDATINPSCDSNTWLRNTLGTVNQPCVRNHVGTVAGSGSSPAAATAPAADTRSARSGGRATL